MSANASDSRCCSPPDRRRHGVFATAESPRRSSSSDGGTGFA